MRRLVPALGFLLLLTSCASSGGASPSLPASAAASLAASQAAAPSATPAPTPGPSTAFCPNSEGGEFNTCLGWLKGGTYHTTTFNPPLTYTVPAGWGNLEDMAGNFLLLPVDGELAGVNAGTSDYLGVYWEVAAPALCTGTADTSVPQTWQGLVDWLHADPALAVANEKQVTISGLDGVVMDLSLKDPKGDGCPEGAWADVYVGINHTSLVHAVIATEPLRIYLLKNGDATTAIEIADAPGGYYTDWPTTADGVVATFKFTPR